MIKIQIRFKDSWTNSFFKEKGSEPLFTSGSQLSDSTMKLNTVDQSTILSTKSRISFLQELQKANPDLKYRVPENYDRTVQGILARLIGEVRRVNDIEPDHLALRAYNAGKYEVNIESENSQMTKLATYHTNDIQTGGAGLIMKEQLYTSTKEAKYLFGFLGLSLNEMQGRCHEILEYGFDDEKFTWTPKSPADFLERMRSLLETQQAQIKHNLKEQKDNYTTPFAEFEECLAKALPVEYEAYVQKKSEQAVSSGKKAIQTIEQGAIDGWSLAGALIVARLKKLSEEERQSMINLGVLTKSGNLSGLAMTGAVGHCTDKDVFRFASSKSAESNRMPYSVNIPMEFIVDGKEKKTYVPTGIIKKSGTLIFTLDDNDNLEDDLHEAIKMAAVGPFSFGKKGIAYVEKIKRS